MQALAHILGEGVNPAPRATLADVVAHIERLLNSRRGQGLCAPLYGASMAHDERAEAMALLPKTMAVLEQGILQSIASYETRFTQWRLHKSSRSDGQTLTVCLQAHLHSASERIALIQCTLKPCGRTTVQLL